MKWWHIALVLVGLFILSELFKSPDPEPAAAAAASTTPEPDKEPEPAKPQKSAVDLSLELLAAAKEEMEAYKKPELVRSLSPSFVNRLEAFQKMARSAKNSDTLSIKNAGQELYTLLEKVQPAIYPQLRKAYTDQVRSELWQHDIDVEMKSGKLYLYGGYFGRNKNKLDTYEKLKPSLEKLRFKAIYFGVIKSEYSSPEGWNIIASPDGRVE